MKTLTCVAGYVVAVMTLMAIGSVYGWWGIGTLIGLSVVALLVEELLLRWVRRR